MSSSSDVAAAPRTVVRGSRRAVARQVGGDRGRLGVLGLLLLLAGAGAALLGYGIFGTGRAARPLLDPMIVDSLRANPTLWRWVAIAAAVVLVALGLVWTARSLRPERRPDLVLESSADTSLLVTAAAVSDAVAERTGALPGVAKVRARMVGKGASPALRLTVWITDEADVAALCRQLDGEIVTEARTALGLAHLPVAVRLELDAEDHKRRVA
jgi:hypothetical protein